MSAMAKISEFAARWSEAQRMRRSVRIIAALPLELQRDIGWPATELFTAAKTRSVLR